MYSTLFVSKTWNPPPSLNLIILLIKTFQKVAMVTNKKNVVTFAFRAKFYMIQIFKMLRTL
jgi:hypothetical protein